MSRFRALVALVLVLALSAPASGQVTMSDGGVPLVDAVDADDIDRTALVDPFIGTFAPGFTNPGPVLPHGMVGLGPDTAEGPLNYGGYYVNNALITGFSHTHMSAGVFHGGHIPVMPVVGDVDTSITPHPAGAPAGWGVIEVSTSPTTGMTGMWPPWKTPADMWVWLNPVMRALLT